MSQPPSPTPRPLTPARLKTAATLFVCTKCTHGNNRRRELKRAVKAAHRKRVVRVVGCGCLDVCPKRGTMTVLACSGAAPRCGVINDAATVAEALAELLDERVGDAVSY